MKGEVKDEFYTKETVLEGGKKAEVQHEETGQLVWCDGFALPEELDIL